MSKELKKTTETILHQKQSVKRQKLLLFLKEPNGYPELKKCNHREKNSLEGISSIFELEEERISKLEGR